MSPRRPPNFGLCLELDLGLSEPFGSSPKSLGLCPSLGTLPPLGLTSGLVPPIGFFAVVIFIK